MADEEPTNGIKRELDEAEGAPGSPSKKLKTEIDSESAEGGGDDDGKDGHPFVPPGTEGVTTINDNDVLSGRGGGTNLHPGNRQFRDLINLYRRDYLKARKNDKPAISRSIVNAIREKNGRFLKKIEKTGLWFEIGDDAAREKTSQALRQRAPEMRKLLLDHEMEGARQQQQMMMGMPGVPPMMMPGMNMPMMMPNGNMPFNPAMMGMPNPAMFNPAMMGMPPMNFNQQGMSQPPHGGMPNGGDGQGNDGNTGEGNGETGEGGGDSNDLNNGNPGNLNHDNNNNNNHEGGAPGPAQMNNGMMMNMMPMNPGGMNMNMGQMGPMPPGMGAPAPESPTQVQQ